MRVFALALFSLVLAAGVASGQAAWRSWSDPAGRLTFEYPPNWPVDVVPAGNADSTAVISGLANEECQFFALARAEWAQHTADVMKRATATTPIGTEAWQTTALSIRLFRNQAVVQNETIDTTTGFWPIQRATIQSGEHSVASAYQRRPGLEIWTFCLTYNNADRTDVFNRVIASVGTPRDAEWRTQAEAAEAQRAAAAAQQAQQQEQAQQQQEEQKQKGRRRRD
jgi:hypothetical protein